MPISNELFLGKYRIPSSRLKDWDYTSAGYYFVTICTQKRLHWFGEVNNGVVTLSPVGLIVRQELENTSIICPNVSIDAWIVMPNHIHAIIIIDEISPPWVETSRRDVSTKPHYLQSGSLGAIVNQFKSVCTKRIRRAGQVTFTWQTRYYDHIIENNKELDRIRIYITGNPIKWEEDEYFSEH